MTYRVIVGLIVFISGIACSAFISLHKPRTPLKILWSLYSLGTAFLGFCLFCLYTTTNYDTALFWCRALDLDILFIPPLFFHVVVLLTNAYARYKKIVIFYYLIIISYFLIALRWSHYFIPTVSPKMGFLYFPDAGPLYYPYPFLGFCVMFHGWIVLHKASQKVSAIKRNQYQYFLWVTAICFCGVASSLFLIFNIPVYPVGLFLLPVHDIAVAYIIVKYHLMDIRIIIRKGLIYTFLGTFITLFYIAAVYLIEQAFHNILGYHSLMGSVGVMALIAFMFIPLKNYIQSFVDKYFFRASYAQMIEQNDLLRQQSIRTQRYQMMSALSLKIITELRNPLTALVGYDYFLSKRLEDREFLNKFATVFHNELQRLQGLIQQLSDFSELKPLDLKNVDLIILMKELLEYLSERFQQQGVVLNKYFNEDHELMINADREQLKRALFIFLAHSIKSTPAKGQVWVGIEEAMEGVEINIKDTGKGLSQEDLSQIFDPFFSASRSGEDVNESLAQAQNIITKHGGKVMVDSQLNVGTEWIIQLPK